MKPLTVVSFLGSTLDAAKFGPSRWSKWRPSVALAMHEDLRIERFVMIHAAMHRRLADQVSEDIASVSPETRVERQVINFDDAWDFEEVYGKLLDFARALDLDPEAEDLLVHITTGTHVAQICLFLLTEAHYLPGRLIQTQPARRVDGAAPGSWAIIDLDLSRYDSIATRFAEDRAQGTSFLKSGIETQSRAFNAMIEEIEQVAARSRAPILLMGPTGAGKSQLARRIHQLKKLKRQVAGAFVEVNCATLRGDGAMSALFGHTRGAFTGAATAREGLLRGADKGMLFLDEIGELGLDEQAMILRAIEDKRFLPVGADREVDSDFQLIAGTNRDLAQGVAQGTFREDLFARLNLWTFTLPGLAQRREDIAPNLDYELDRHAEREGERISFNREAREAYLAFATDPRAPWKGNFRDLAASVTRMATFAPKGRIDTATVTAEIARLQRLWGAAGPTRDGLDDLLDDAALTALDPFDRVQLAFVIDTCRQSRSLSEAGRTLFAASRTQRTSTNDADRLRKYLARFGLRWGMLEGEDLKS
ncbi:RNA repair transcriptional activator RtcR [Novosphingobium sp. 1949]|uniref:RNA repair transcriptional activator RtcR n=1 Tax=Novosphingobium organovorum TaxID=2930092 RepID=A0ABT0BGP4_9SPHN|nr:RNA repair transcriptional activator RtcR [Novosphingobium organovorum]MCJ2184194.1 RNA repair transcriptional activator RtcR [Novosphingobium organovorum]